MQMTGPKLPSPYHVTDVHNTSLSSAVSPSQAQIIQ